MEILTVAGVTALLVTFFTLVFQYAPKLRVKWAGINSETKKLIILGLYIIAGAFVAFGGCVDFLAKFIASLQCVDAPTFMQYVIAVLVAVGGGQGVFDLLPELDDVQITKAARL